MFLKLYICNKTSIINYSSHKVSKIVYLNSISRVKFNSIHVINSNLFVLQVYKN